MNLELNYPVQNPINQSNLFGAISPMYTNLGQKGHPGIDFECPMYTPIYSPCDGDAFYAYDGNGGDGIYIRVPNNAKPEYNVILWHLPPRTDSPHWVIKNSQGVVTQVKTGELIGYTGDSGYPIESSGPHLHLGVMPCDSTGGASDINNGYKGCVDPMPFLVKPIAQAVPSATVAVDTSALIVNEIASSTESNSDKSWQLFSIAKVVKQILSWFS